MRIYVMSDVDGGVVCFLPVSCQLAPAAGPKPHNHPPAPALKLLPADGLAVVCQGELCVCDFASDSISTLSLKTSIYRLMEDDDRMRTRVVS